MKIEIGPKDIKFKIQVGVGKFEEMIGSLVKIKNHEVGIAPAIIKDVIYVTMTDLRTGVRLYRFPFNGDELESGSTRETALILYKRKINLLNEELYDYIFKKADESLTDYVAAPAYEFLEVEHE